MCFAVMNKLTPASICTLSGGVATFLTLLFPCPRPPAPGHGPGIAPDRGLLTGPRLLCPWEAGLLLSGNTHYHACLPGAKSAKCGPWQLNLWVPLRSNIPSCEDSGCVFCFEHRFSLAVRHSESSLGVPLVGEQAPRGSPSPSSFQFCWPRRGTVPLPLASPLLAAKSCSPGRHPLLTCMAQGGQVCVLRWVTGACGASLSGACVSSGF